MKKGFFIKREKMDKEKVRKAIKILLIAALVPTIGYLIYYRVTHPDLTEFRCSLNNWKLCTFALVDFGILGWLLVNE